MPRTRNVPVRKVQSYQSHQLHCPHPNCDRAFKNKSGLKQHCRTIHAHTAHLSSSRLGSGLRCSPASQTTEPELLPGNLFMDADPHLLGPSSSCSPQNEPAEPEIRLRTPLPGSPHHSDIGAGSDPLVLLPGGSYSPVMDMDMPSEIPLPGSLHSDGPIENPHRLGLHHRHYPSSPMDRAQARRNRQARNQVNHPASKTYHPLINGAYS